MSRELPAWIRAAALAACLMSIAAAPVGAQDITVRIIEEPYREVHAFLGVYFEGMGSQSAEQGSATIDDASQIGFGLRLMSARRTSIQLETGIGFRQVDVKDLGDPDQGSASFLDMQIGGRFYPLTPSFALGNTAFRLTFAAKGGLTMGSVFGAGLDFSVGIGISSGTDPNGFMIEFVTRPMEYSIEDVDEILPDMILAPSWILRLGFQFGPS